MRRPQLLRLDFDGVISLNSIGLQRDWVVRRLSSAGVIGASIVDDLVRSVATSVRAPVTLQLISLIYGVTWTAEDMAALEREVMSAIVVDESFELLIKRCRAGGMAMKILSMASNNLLRALPGVDAEMLCPPPGESKADPATFLRLASTWCTPVSLTRLVDDTPMVLRAVKLAGFQTALIGNGLYRECDYREHRSYIDVRGASLADVLSLLLEPAES